eukprot:c11611_g1_i1.p1 GENE.c11611_g1_i1~~c11611_g1_i1.p1  ORF type:complete len:138 (-),score=34.12 c11611_g1_i1:133-546(-)
MLQKEEQVNPTMYASQWFMTLFSYNFPFETVLRLWDIFFSEGFITIYRVALALLTRGETELLQLPLGGIYAYLKAQAKGTHEQECKDLLDTALAIDLSPARIKDIVKEYTDSPAVRAAAQPSEKGDFAFTKPSWLTS